MYQIPPTPVYQNIPYFQPNYNQPELAAPAMGNNATNFNKKKQTKAHFITSLMPVTLGQYSLSNLATSKSTPPPPPSMTTVPQPPSYQPRPYFQPNCNQPKIPTPSMGTNASLFTEENRGSFHHFPDAPDTWPAFAYHFGYQHNNTPHIQQKPPYNNPPRDYKPIKIYYGSTLTSSHDYNEWDKQAWHKVLLENPILDTRIDIHAITLWSALDVFLCETLLTKITYNQQAMGTQVSMVR